MIQQLPEKEKESVVKGLNKKDQENSQIPVQRDHVLKKEDPFEEGHVVFQNLNAHQRSFNKEDDLIILNSENG